MWQIFAQLFKNVVATQAAKFVVKSTIKSALSSAVKKVGKKVALGNLNITKLSDMALKAHKLYEREIAPYMRAVETAHSPTSKILKSGINDEILSEIIDFVRTTRKTKNFEAKVLDKFADLVDEKARYLQERVEEIHKEGVGKLIERLKDPNKGTDVIDIVRELLEGDFTPEQANKIGKQLKDENWSQISVIFHQLNYVLDFWGRNGGYTSKEMKTLRQRIIKDVLGLSDALNFKRHWVTLKNGKRKLRMSPKSPMKQLLDEAKDLKGKLQIQRIRLKLGDLTEKATRKYIGKKRASKIRGKLDYETNFED